jgi:hypothetical protein
MKLAPWFWVLSALALVHPQLFGQDQVKPSVVSPLIGDTLDVAERDHYQLFLNLKGFEWAVFYLNPDSSLKVKVSLLEDGARRDTIIAGSRSLAALRNHIQLVAQKDAEVGFKDEKEEGAEVVLLLNNGQEIKGELVSVRDSAVVISTIEDIDEKELASQTASISVIKNQEILHVTVKGKSNLLKGMGLGTLIGVGSGALLGLASGDDPPGWFSFSAGEKAAALGILLGGAGFIVGTIAGVISSKGSKEIEPLPDLDFSSLKSVARYPAGEPGYLREIK